MHLFESCGGMNGWETGRSERMIADKGCLHASISSGVVIGVTLALLAFSSRSFFYLTPEPNAYPVGRHIQHVHRLPDGPHRKDDDGPFTPFEINANLKHDHALECEFQTMIFSPGIHKWRDSLYDVTEFLCVLMGVTVRRSLHNLTARIQKPCVMVHHAMVSFKICLELEG